MSSKKHSIPVKSPGKSPSMRSPKAEVSQHKQDSVQQFFWQERMNKERIMQLQ